MEPSPYSEQRYKDGLECAMRATQYDQEGHFSGAMAFYTEAVSALSQACAMAPVFSPILPRVDEYARRAEAIRLHLTTQQAVQRPLTGSSMENDQRLLQQVQYMLELAVVDDEAGRRPEAEKMYLCAVDLALKATKQMTNDESRSVVKTLATESLNRVEHLKKRVEPSAPSLDDLLSSIPAPPSTDPQRGAGGKGTPTTSRMGGGGRSLPRGPLLSFLEADQDLSKPPDFSAYKSGSDKPRGQRSTSPSRQQPHVATVGGKMHKGARFTDAELKVLRSSSVINGVTYLPWSDADLAELRVISPIASNFCDPDGLLPLSDKQRGRFEGWVRPEDMCQLPVMLHLISSFTIKQTLIGDCSFIASLAVCADYERRFKTRLVTRCIHPRNRRGDPIINPHGKYFISFNLNGCRRKVVIDDRLPMGQHGGLLCSYSSNGDEFWISLIEKAYMKVMGGYDFPGSSSNIDLHALTGWIPERSSLRDCSAAMFSKMEQAMRKGRALMTVATGPLGAGEAERAGLVPTHAYAVLNVVTIKGLSLMQLKNPWSERRWKGNYSEQDKTHWTPELRKLLNFDQMEALQLDNGVFWIDWQSIKRFFDVVYFNWNPDLFRHKSTLHDSWKPSGVAKDVYDLSNNPQYALHVHNAGPPASLWVLLSRHITTKSDFANNEKFITLHVARTRGQRVFFPEKFFVQGIKINTPHYLAKLEDLPQGSSSFTIIVSQLESLSTIFYSLRVYSTCEFNVSPVPNPYCHTKQLKGEWRSGQQEHPKFLLTTASFNSGVFIKLQAPKELFVRLEIKADSPSLSFHPVDSGALRQGFTVLEAVDLPKGSFAVLPTTFTALATKPVPFFLTVSCDNVFNFTAASS